MDILAQIVVKNQKTKQVKGITFEEESYIDLDTVIEELGINTIDINEEILEIEKYEDESSLEYESTE